MGLLITYSRKELRDNKLLDDFCKTVWRSGLTEKGNSRIKFFENLVVELKVSLGYERVVGQTLFYQSSIKTIFKQNKVRVIIVAREITSELKTATQFLPDFELFEYQLSLTLNKIK